MNGREANDLREALKKLEHGPGSGWIRVIAGTDDIGPKRSDAERARSVEIWLESWITPSIQRLVDRYWKGIPAGRRRGIRSVRSPTSATLNAVYREGEERQNRADRGGEDPPYWVGYYKQIARRAIDRLAELEARS